MNLQTLLLFFLAQTSARAFLMGGWHDINLTDDRVLSATDFVVTQTFGGSTEWTLIDAKQQTVHGTNLELTVQIQCELHRFRILLAHDHIRTEMFC